MFDEYFDVYLADTLRGQEEHYNLRYKVYCEEMGFEDKNEFLSEQERDRWDKHSVHFLVRHRETEQWVGAMRMVFQQKGLLPLQEYCSINQVSACQSQTIEISRLCLLKDIRRRKTDEEPPLGLNTQADSSINEKNVTNLHSRRHINRSIIWGLFRAASIYSVDHQIDNWYFLCTKALARIISKEGFNMIQVGDGCYHRGERFPYRIELCDILDNNIWSNDFKKGYRLFSELEQNEMQEVKVA